MKRAHLLAGAADRATMVDGCPLGPVTAATSAAIFGTPQSLGKTTAIQTPLDDLHEQRLYAQSANLKNRGY